MVLAVVRCVFGSGHGARTREPWLKMRGPLAGAGIAFLAAAAPPPPAAAQSICMLSFEAESWERAGRACHDEAARGSALAKVYLGALHTVGRGGVPRDLNRAESLFRENIAALQSMAAQGAVHAQNMLGFAHMNGYGVNKDHFAAAKWFRLAANRGLPSAMNNYGGLLLDGIGVPRDEAAALRWFRAGAARGHGLAMYNLGIVYSKGRGVPQDLGAAIAWLRKAAARDIHKAQSTLGDAYWWGTGVAPSKVIAFAWFRIAANGSDPDSIQALRNIVPKMSAAEIAEGERHAVTLRQQLARERHQP
jgi:hypothetical protein